MIVLHMADLLTKAEGGGDLQLHFRAVFCIPAPALCFPEHRHCKGVISYQLLNILLDTVLIAVFLCLKPAAHLIAETEGNSLIYNRLTAQHIPIVFSRDIDVGKHILIRSPMKQRACLFPVCRFFFQSALISALFKVQIIAEAVTADGGVKKLRSVLGSARAKSVQAKGILIVFTVFAVLATGIHFTEHQLPVIALFFFIIVHGAAPSKVLHFHRKVFVAGDDDRIAVTFSCLVDGVGKNLKYCVFTAFQIVRAKNNSRALTNPLFPFQHRNTGVTVLFLC